MAGRQYLRILPPPKGSFFLYGVRGVGKRTWARETFPDAHIIDLLDESRYQALLANPALLGLELRTLPAHRVVVLDEVQRVPALLNEVHRAIEGARRRFVLVGSSARRLKTADTNLLAGRAVRRRRGRRSRDTLASSRTLWWRRSCRHSRRSCAFENGNTRNSIGSIRGWLALLSDSWVRSPPRNAAPCSKASS